MRKFDIGIIGGGVIGGLIARELGAYNVSVAVFEGGSDVALGASKANSGIVHAGFDAGVGTLKAKLNVLGNAMYEKMCQSLGVKYKNTGSLVVAFKSEDMEKLQALYDRGVENGVKELQLLSKEQVLLLEPALNIDVCGGLLAPTGGITCPYELTVAAIGNAMDNGVQLFLETEVQKISKNSESFILNDMFDCAYVINCAGLHADKVAKMIGDESFSLSPRRGEYLLLDKESGGYVSRTVFTVPTKMGKGILVSPTVDGNLLLGPTSEDMQDKNDKATTLSGMQKVRSSALYEFPTLPLRNVITSFSGLRAVGDTEDFIIRESDVKNFIHVAGIESPGLTAAPAIAKYVVDILLGIGMKLVPKSKVVESRQRDNFFSLLSVKEKNALIKKDSRYGRIICRCEEITEGEIVHAMKINPPARSIDAIKRRTRSGMGRCQGGFCAPQIVEIMARETNQSPLDVLKSGKGSVMNVCKTKSASEVGK